MPRPLAKSLIFITLLVSRLLAASSQQDTGIPASNTVGSTSSTDNNSTSLSEHNTATNGTTAAAHGAPAASPSQQTNDTNLGGGTAGDTARNGTTSPGAPTPTPVPTGNGTSNSTAPADRSNQTVPVPTFNVAVHLANKTVLQAQNITPQSKPPAQNARSVPNQPISPEEAALLAQRFMDALQARGNLQAASSVPPDYQAMFDLSNQKRVRHGAPVAQWYDQLQYDAQNWASSCTFSHAYDRNGAGENLYATTSTDWRRALTDAIDAWYSEVSNYDFSTNSGRLEIVGHFTQMVWVNSQYIGCAAAVCSGGIQYYYPGTIVVCRYQPPGNVVGQYAQNVKPVVSTHTPPAAQQQYYTPMAAAPPSPPAQNMAVDVAASGADFQGPGCRNSPNGQYWLCVWDSGEAILYRGNSMIWRTATSYGGYPWRLVVWSTGNIFLDNRYGQFVWQSNSGNRGTFPYRLLLQDDGFLVLYDARNSRIWSSP